MKLSSVRAGYLMCRHGVQRSCQCLFELISACLITQFRLPRDALKSFTRRPAAFDALGSVRSVWIALLTLIHMYKDKLLLHPTGCYFGQLLARGRWPGNNANGPVQFAAAGGVMGLLRSTKVFARQRLTGFEVQDLASLRKQIKISGLRKPGDHMDRYSWIHGPLTRFLHERPMENAEASRSHFMLKLLWLRCPLSPQGTDHQTGISIYRKQAPVDNVHYSTSVPTGP